MQITLPNAEILNLQTLILDLNGTLTVHGEVVSGAAEKIAKIKDKGIRVVLFSGDTRGTAQVVAEELGMEFIRASKGEEKKLAAKQFDPDTCVAIGNGRIDAPLFGIVKLAIATLQAEGVHMDCLREADIIVPSILDALDLLLDEQALIATLRP